MLIWFWHFASINGGGVAFDFSGQCAHRQECLGQYNEYKVEHDGIQDDYTEAFFYVGF